MASKLGAFRRFSHWRLCISHKAGFHMDSSCKCNKHNPIIHMIALSTIHNDIHGLQKMDLIVADPLPSATSAC